MFLSLNSPFIYVVFHCCIYVCYVLIKTYFLLTYLLTDEHVRKTTIRADLTSAASARAVNGVSRWTLTAVRTVRVDTATIVTHTRHHHTLIYVYAHTYIHIHVFMRLRLSRKLHVATCSTSQLLTTSQHHSPTQILPCNHINLRIHAHPHNTYPHISHTDLYANNAARI